LLAALLGAACAHAPLAAVEPTRPTEVLAPLSITGDLRLEQLNDEELFAAGTTFYAATEFEQAARYFGRICDFHETSAHRREALYNAGLALEKLAQWEEALTRFQPLADPSRGTGDSLDASFRLAEVLYNLRRHDEASEVLKVIGARRDLPEDKRIEARVQQGVCELEAGRPDAAESIFRDVVSGWQGLKDRDSVDEFFPAQAQFFLGEIFRGRYEGVVLDGNARADQLAKDLEYKSELLLSSQGHYLRAIRMGNGYWATAAGQRIGGLYESMYDHLMHSPAPSELDPVEQEVYRTELRRRIRVLIGKAISIYEHTLQAAERIGTSSPFVVQTRESLTKMKELLLTEARSEEAAPPAPRRPGS
jgi:tetratricopeptide (TPR) repeat protein